MSAALTPPPSTLLRRPAPAAAAAPARPMRVRLTVERVVPGNSAGAAS